MEVFRRFSFDPDKAVRMIADTLMVNVALLSSLILRYLWEVGVEGGVVSPQATFHQYIQTYLTSCWPLTLVSLLLFHVSGFYSHGRFYRGRYKALAIGQAVSLSYLIFSLLVLLSWDLIDFPRSVLISGWLLTLVFVMGARLWAGFWKAAVKAEHYLIPSHVKDDRPGKVLVIGGAGYIGSALLPKLLDKGYHVRLFDLLLYGTEPIQNVLNHPHLEIVRADFRQVEAVVQAMRNVEAVIHLGAIVGDPACAVDEDLTIEVNLMATRMVAEVAKGSGVKRLIFASTCSVYGASDELLDERSSLKPVSLYARSKIASERVLTPMASNHFAPVILRFGTIYGLSGRTRFDLVVNLLTAKAIVDGQITIYGGDQWRPFLHVDDAALAIFKVLEAPLPLVHNQVFNIGSNHQNYTIRQVGEIIHGVVPTAQIIDKGMDTDQRNYRVDFSKIRRMLGFVPQWSVERGIQQVIAALQSGRIVDYRAPEYSNVKFLSIRNEAVSDLLRHENGWAYDLLKETLPKKESSSQHEPASVPVSAPSTVPASLVPRRA